MRETYHVTIYSTCIYTSRLFNVFNAELHTDFRINKLTSEKLYGRETCCLVWKQPLIQSRNHLKILLTLPVVHFLGYLFI